MFKTIGDIDRKISTPIIQADNVIISIILYPFAAFFHPKLIFLAYFSVWYFSGRDLHTILVYVMGTGICLLTTFILKKITKRPRPLLIEKSKKPHNFRKKQKNNSFPSGDAIQSALFVFYLHYLGVPTPYLIMFHIGVCLGRVYYMCHWLMDTMASTVLGYFINSFLVYLLQTGTLTPIVAQIQGFTGDL